MPFPIARKTELISVNAEQMKEVDRLMVSKYGISSIQMMENAGKSLARLARELFFENSAKFKNIIVLAGSGGNGGGALVCARHLHNYGAKVQVAISRPADYLSDLPLHQLRILKKMGIEVKEANTLKMPKINFDLVIDGLIGYSLRGNPKAGAAKLIDWANSQNAPILSLDVPSGVDVGNGEIYEPAIKASATMTLALPKQGLFDLTARPNIGRLFLADISVPPQLYAEKPLELIVPPMFSEGDILEIKMQ